MADITYHADPNVISYIGEKVRSNSLNNLKFTRFGASYKTDVTDMLNVDISANGKNSEANKPSFVSTSNAQTLTNLPSYFGSYTSDFIAIRTVDWLSEKRVFVTLHELYPEQGRVWTNHYNYASWSGWKCTAGVDPIVAEGTYSTGDLHWVKYANGFAVCYWRKTFTIPSTSWIAVTNGYKYSDTIGWSGFPFSFTSAPSIVYGLRSATPLLEVATGDNAGDLTSPGSFNIVKASKPSSTITATFAYVAFGWWK